MINPHIEDLLNHVDSRYSLVVVASKRARQINSYYTHLGEGTREFVPPQVGTLAEHEKPLSIALQEVAAGKFTAERPPELEIRIK